MEGDKTIERKREEESVEQREQMQEKEERVKAKEREGEKESRENIRTTAQLCTAEAEDPTGGTTVSISGQT